MIPPVRSLVSVHPVVPYREEIPVSEPETSEQDQIVQFKDLAQTHEILEEQNKQTRKLQQHLSLLRQINHHLQNQVGDTNELLTKAQSDLHENEAALAALTDERDEFRNRFEALLAQNSHLRELSEQRFREVGLLKQQLEEQIKILKVNLQKTRHDLNNRTLSDNLGAVLKDPDFKFYGKVTMGCCLTAIAWPLTGAWSLLTLAFGFASAHSTRCRDLAKSTVSKIKNMEVLDFITVQDNCNDNRFLECDSLSLRVRKISPSEFLVFHYDKERAKWYDDIGRFSMTSLNEDLWFSFFQSQGERGYLNCCKWEIYRNSQKKNL